MDGENKVVCGRAMRFSAKRIVITMVATIGLALLYFLVTFWPHLAWQLRRKLALDDKNVSEVQVTILNDMSEVLDRIADRDTLQIDVGNLALKIPTSFKEDLDASNPPGWRSIRCDELVVRIQQPLPNARVRDELLKHSLRGRNEEPHSYARTLLDIYSVDCDDFRWTMTYEELAYHKWLLFVSEIYWNGPTESLEVYYGDRISTVVHRREHETVLEWIACNGEYIGTIIIEGTSCNGMDRIDVARLLSRTISWTLKCRNRSRK